MVDPEGHDEGASASLVALLDLVERPAAALGAGGVILGANAHFFDFARERGAVVLDRLDGLVSRESAEELERVRERGRTTSLRVAFRDGVALSVRFEALAPPADDVAVLVFEPADEDEGERALRARASLRHDLAGPLTAILGTAELLLVREGETMSNEVRESLSAILENCGRMSQILAESRLRDHRGGEEGEP